MTDQALQELEEIQEDAEQEAVESEDSQETEEQKVSNENSDMSVEDRAKLMGWSPKEDYKGDPEMWRDAESYVEDAEKDFRRMRRVNQVLERKLDKALKGNEAILSYQKREIEQKEKEAYERGLAELDKRLEEAVEEGDVEAAKKVWSEKDNFRTQTNDQDIANRWISERDWYNKDFAMRSVARDYEGELAIQGVDSLEDRLKQTDAFIREEFPHKFGGQKKTPPVNAVNGRGNNVTKPPPKPGTYEALNQEARHECDRAVKSSNGKITKEAWLKYAEPHMFSTQR